MNARDKTYEQLSAHLDGELSPPEAERLARTLEADEDLRRELAELAAVRDLLRSVPIERAPDDLAGSVLAEAERSQLVGRARAETPTGALRWIRYLATAAVLLVAVAVGAIIAVTLWSPPRPEYETRLAHRRERGETGAVIMHDLERRRLGTEATTAGSGHGKVGGDIVAGSRFTFADGNSAGRALNGAMTTVTLAAKEGEERYAKSLSGRIAGEGGTGSHYGRGEDIQANDLVKNVGNLELALAQAVENNEIIFTDHMALTAREVEKVLVANDIQPMVVKESEALAKTKAIAHYRANVFRQSQLSERQVQYEAWVTPEQMPEVQKQIRSIRAEQRVSQFLAKAPTGGADDLGYAETKWGPRTEDGMARRGADEKKLGELVNGKTAEAAEEVDGDMRVGGKGRPAQDAPAVPAARPAPEPTAEPAAKPDAGPAVTSPAKPLPPLRTPAKAGPGYVTAEATREKDAHSGKDSDASKKVASGAQPARARGPAMKPAPTPKPAAEAPTDEEDAATRGRRTQKRTAAPKDKPHQATQTGADVTAETEVEPGHRDDQQSKLRESVGQLEGTQATKPHDEVGLAKVESGGERREAQAWDYAGARAGWKDARGAQSAPAPPATAPAEARPSVQLEVVGGRQIAAKFKQETARGTAAVDELSAAGVTLQPTSRPFAVKATTRPTTQAGAVAARQRPVPDGRSGLWAADRYALKKFQQLDLTERAKEYYEQAQKATSQQATARLQRLLITVNFRSLSEADRAASMERRAKQAQEKSAVEAPPSRK